MISAWCIKWLTIGYYTGICIYWHWLSFDCELLIYNPPCKHRFLLYIPGITLSVCLSVHPSVQYVGLYLTKRPTNTHNTLIKLSFIIYHSILIYIIILIIQILDYEILAELRSFSVVVVMGTFWCACFKSSN